MIVLRSELDKQFERFRIRLGALDRTIGHVGRGLSFAIYRFHIRALGDEVENHLDVATRRRVMQRGVAFVIARIDVGTEFFNQVLH